MIRNRTRHVAVALAILMMMLVAGRPSAAGDLPGARPDQVGLNEAKLKEAGALFRRAVEQKEIAGAVLLVTRHGKVAYLEAIGKQDAEAGIAMSPATIFRIASMTKPITSTAAMILAEEGRLDLSDPISKYLPEFCFMKVAVPRERKAGAGPPGSSGEEYDLIEAYRPITVRDLLMHTSGLCYRFTNRPILGRMYAEASLCDGLTPSDITLAENVRRLAGLPLLHQPGTAWEYGLNTDVLGRLVEVVSGRPLDQFCAESILRPLRMDDTFFLLPEDRRDRLAALYEPGPDGKIRRTADGPVTRGALIYSPDAAYRQRPGYFSGGAGLLSTAGDYARFLQMLLHRGELDGVRVLRPETVTAMTRDQTEGLPMWIPVHGLAFGYGYGVTTRPDPSGRKDPVGTFGWGGIYYTDFWVDPKDEVIGIMMTQVYPSGPLKLRDEFHRLVNEAIRR
ncbi:MAG: serine hydrolase domain-containing protein [Isosphaeraceae bacterium]